MHYRSIKNGMNLKEHCFPLLKHSVRTILPLYEIFNSKQHHHLQMRYTGGMRRVLTIFGYTTLCVGILGMILSSFPAILAFEASQEQSSSMTAEQFPVTVDPKNKTIVENQQVNDFFESSHAPFQAAIGNTKYTLTNLFEWIAVAIDATPWYQMLAAADNSEKVVAITAGMRKEQIADTFAKTLFWSAAQKKEFVNSSSPLPEGSFAPGIYAVAPDTSPSEVQDMLRARFTNTILSRYGTKTAEIVPLDQALTIASLIEREASGKYDMRMISGVIWNRLFIGMNLQIDATVQYAKASKTKNGNWWPRVLPSDTSLRSPYNTYLQPGLPPTPIANPSVAAVFAALNPKKTSCLFYFHDDARKFHCTDTYEEHVAMLKKYYGQGR